MPSYLPLVVCALLFCHVNTEVVFYSTPSSNLPSGFGVISDSIASLSDSPLQSFIGKLQLTSVNEDWLVVYGEMQYWEAQQSGGVLLYNLQNNSYSTFRNLFGSEAYGIVPTTGDTVAIIGDYPGFNSIALCNLVSKSCNSMGKGLVNLRNLQGIASNGDDVYVYYLDTYLHLVVAMWSENSWNIILNSTWGREMTWNKAATFANNMLYISASGYALTGNNFCDGQTVYSVAAWNGTCWSSVTPNSNWGCSIEGSPIFENDNTLYALVYGAIYIFENDNCSSISPNITWGQSFNCPCVFSEGFLYGIIDVEYSMNSTIARVDVSSFDSKFAPTISFTETLCETYITGLAAIQDAVYYTCAGNTSFVIHMLNSTSQVLSQFTSLDQVYGGVSEASFFSYDGNMIVAAPMVAIGTEPTGQNIALWNSSHWITLPPVFDSFDYQNDLFGCANMSGNFIVAWGTLGPYFEEYTLHLVSINPQTLSYEVYEPYNMTAVGSSLTDIYIVESTINIIIAYVDFESNVCTYFLEYGNWTCSTQYVFPILGALVVDDVIYLGGGIYDDSVSWTESIMKFNTTSGEKMPMQVASGAVYAIAAGSIPGMEATLYVAGYSYYFGGILGYDNLGNLVDYAKGVFPAGVQCVDIVFDSAFYVACNKQEDFSSIYTLYVYDGKTATIVATNVQGIGFYKAAAPIHSLPLIIPEHSSSHAKPRKSYKVLLVIGIIVAVVAVIATVVTIFVIKRRRAHKYSPIPTYQELDK